jgi:hypothetical protein
MLEDVIDTLESRDGAVKYLILTDDTGEEYRKSNKPITIDFDWNSKDDDDYDDYIFQHFIQIVFGDLSESFEVFRCDQNFTAFFKTDFQRICI